MDTWYGDSRDDFDYSHSPFSYGMNSVFDPTDYPSMSNFGYGGAERFGMQDFKDTMSKYFGKKPLAYSALALGTGMLVAGTVIAATQKTSSLTGNSRRKGAARKGRKGRKGRKARK